MPPKKESASKPKPRTRRPAETPEGREMQLIDLAVDLAEKQLADGTATSQVISHYLKMGSTREIYEQERLRLENELTKAKVSALESQARQEELYAEALKAMRSYAGQPEPMDPDEDYYED